MMKLCSVVSLLFSLVALILSLLCLFAGSTKSFLQNGDLLTIGQGDVFNTTNGDEGFLSGLINDAQGDLNNLISEAAGDISTALNLPDFYAVHVTNYCKGYFGPNTTENTKMNTTFCSSRNALFHFNLTQLVEDALPNSITLQDIQWPEKIMAASRVLKVANIVMVIFYMVGITFTGFVVLCTLFHLFLGGRISACGQLILGKLSFLTIGIASTISTVTIYNVVNATNKYGHGIGIAATKGDLFLGMTWTATVAMSLVICMSILQCIA